MMINWLICVAFVIGSIGGYMAGSKACTTKTGTMVCTAIGSVIGGVFFPLTIITGVFALIEMLD